MRNGTRGLRALSLALTLFFVTSGVAHAGWRAHAHWRGLPGAWWMPPSGGTLHAGDGANWVTFDPATGTVYVVDNLANTVSVLDAAACARRCDQPVATLATGHAPIATALDARTRTLYASNVDDGTVSVFDVANCNAHRTTGCGPARATVNVGGAPLGIVIDPPSDAVYVGTDQDGLAVIDGTACNRTATSGCATVGRVPTGAGSAFPFADPSTRTIYVPGPGPEADTMAIVDARDCAHGCLAVASAPVGHGGFNGGMDPTTHTVYVANADDNTVSVLDGARCNATNTSGCGQAAPVTSVGPGPEAGLVIDPALHTMYVIAAAQDLMSVVDTAHCRAADTSGCDRTWPTLQTGQSPARADIDPRTHTVYVAAYAQDAVSVLDATSCNALRRDGCRHEAPALDAGASVGNMSIDRRLHTLYADDPNLHALALFDTAHCAPAHCVSHVEPVPGVSGPADVAVDEATHTIYIVNQDDHTVALLDAATCNVSRSGGCVPIGAPVPIPGRPINLAIDQGSHAVYVTGVDDSRLYRIDGAHCRIGDRSRCTPLSGAVGAQPIGVELDAATGTIYTANDSGTVSVIDARRCCAAKATVTVGHHAQDVAFDPGTRTLYVANFGDEAEAGSVSVVDTRACNASVVSGCGQKPRALADGRGAIAVSVDPDTHAVYTADILHGTVSTLDGRTCNALRTDGCDQAPRYTATSFFPLDVLLDGGSLYVTSGFASTLEVLPVG